MKSLAFDASRDNIRYPIWGPTQRNVASPMRVQQVAQEVLRGVGKLRVSCYPR